MAIDPNIALGTKPPVIAPTNPLVMMGQYAQLKNALNQNQLFGSQQAAGQAFLDSVGPDGTPNQADLMQNLKANPQTALAAQDTAQKGQTLDQTTYTEHMQHLTTASNEFSALAAQTNGMPSKDQIQGVVNNLVKKGSITSQEVPGVMAQFGDNNAENGLTITRNHIGNLTAQAGLLTAYGSPDMVNTGGTQQPVVVRSPALGGGVTPVPGAMPNTMTPGEAATPVTIPQPSGAAPTFLKGQLATPRRRGAASRWRSSVRARQRQLPNRPAAWSGSFPAQWHSTRFYAGTTNADRRCNVTRRRR